MRDAVVLAAVTLKNEHLLANYFLNFQLTIANYVQPDIPVESNDPSRLSFFVHKCNSFENFKDTLIVINNN